MILLAQIGLFVVVVSFFTFVILFGRLPGLRKTPVGWLSVFLVEGVPRHVRSLDQRVFGGRLKPVLRAIGNYFFHTNNPVVLIIFMVLVTGSSFMFLLATYDKLSVVQWIFSVIFLSQPYIFTYLCVTNKAIRITPANHAARMLDYPFDHAIYRPGVMCSTCKFEKPARSKHCSLCGVCVAKADHHCPWLANCLGADSYRYFLGVLLSMFTLEAYGVFLGWCFLSPYLQFRPAIEGLSVFSAAFWDRATGVILRAIDKGGLSIAGVTILAFATAPLPLAMFGYHVYLIWAGTTTNENAKWAYLQEDMDDGIVFKAKRSQVVAYKQDLAASRQDSGMPIPEEPHVDWPIATDQIIARTSDGLAPRGLEHLYEQIWSLQAVENLYDLGFWDNIVYVLRGR